MDFEERMERFRSLNSRLGLRPEDRYSGISSLVEDLWAEVQRLRYEARETNSLEASEAERGSFGEIPERPYQAFGEHA